MQVKMVGKLMKAASYELVTLKKGMLLLYPSEYRGLNTPFEISAKVEIGSKVDKEA